MPRKTQEVAFHQQKVRPEQETWGTFALLLRMFCFWPVCGYVQTPVGQLAGHGSVQCWSCGSCAPLCWWAKCSSAFRWAPLMRLQLFADFYCGNIDCPKKVFPLVLVGVICEHILERCANEAVCSVESFTRLFSELGPLPFQLHRVLVRSCMGCNFSMNSSSKENRSKQEEINCIFRYAWHKTHLCSLQI